MITHADRNALILTIMHRSTATYQDILAFVERLQEENVDILNFKNRIELQDLQAQELDDFIALSSYLDVREVVKENEG